VIFFTLFRKDALLVWRNRALLVTLVVYPLLVVGVLGLAFADPEQRIPIAVVELVAYDRRRRGLLLLFAGDKNIIIICCFRVGFCGGRKSKIGSFLTNPIG
jgi:hypothetical protein